MTRPLLLILTITTATTISGVAQTCRYHDLSKKYNYVVTAVKMKDADDEQPRVKKITVQIKSKVNKKQIQRITIAPEYLYQTAFQSCAAARSYITGKNKNAEADDNDYGDFIAADFNFDNREDFAVKRDSGGNGGAFYEYYIQNKRGTFVKDSFLTDVMGYFPGTFDRRRQRLITYIHANVAGYNENIYKYNSTTGKWILFKQTYRKAGQ